MTSRQALTAARPRPPFDAVAAGGDVTAEVATRWGMVQAAASSPTRVYFSVRDPAGWVVIASRENRPEATQPNGVHPESRWHAHSYASRRAAPCWSPRRVLRIRRRLDATFVPALVDWLESRQGAAFLAQADLVERDELRRIATRTEQRFHAALTRIATIRQSLVDGEPLSDLDENLLLYGRVATTPAATSGSWQIASRARHQFTVAAASATMALAAGVAGRSIGRRRAHTRRAA